FQRETRTIPIVFASVSDPVGEGFVASLPRPGGNITGFIRQEATMAGKWLELLTEIAPGVKRVAAIFNPDTAPRGGLYVLPAFEAAARSFKVAPIAAPIHSDAEIETVITSLGREPGGGLVVPPDVFLFSHRAHIILLAARNNVPTVYPDAVWARDGGLLSYGPKPGGHLSALSGLCRSHSSWRQSGGASGSAADQIRNGNQCQGCQSARPYCPPIDSAARQRSNRIRPPTGASQWARFTDPAVAASSQKPPGRVCGDRTRFAAAAPISGLCQYLTLASQHAP